LRVGVAGMLNCSAKRVSVCIAFMTHTWKPGPFSVETITTPSTFPIQNAAVLSPSLWDVRNAKHSPIAAFLLRLRQPPAPPQLKVRTMNTATNGSCTILVVDDFDDTRLLLRTWLERRGFRVVEAENGIQAINQAETEAPDLIIMDMQMPELDGLSATRRIRKSLDSVPILAVSAYGADQFREQALAAGCNEYVSTPFEPAALEGIIRSLVQR